MPDSIFSKPIIHKSKDVKDFGLGKNHKVKVESNIVMPILAESIYKNPLSSIRELYNNEKTSCYKARKLGLKNQRIEININTETRDLTIQGYNSIGISKKVFEDIILNVGVSGNNSQDSIGMFGLGVYSYSLLSENCIITTKSYEDNNIKSYLGKSALNFEDIENQEELKEYGTKFYLNVKDNINFNDLIKTIHDITKFSDIPTYLTVNDNNEPLIQYDDIFDYFEKTIKPIKNKNESLAYYEVKTDDYDIIYYKFQGINYRNSYGNSELVLLNTPIEFYHNNYRFDYIINIKNERLFEPHVSRDFFSDESKTKISDLIDDKFVGFAGTDKTHKNLKEWYKDDLKWFNWNFIDDDFRTYGLQGKDPLNPRKKRLKDLKTLLPLECPKAFYYSNKWNKSVYNKLKSENKFIVFTEDYITDNFVKLGFKEYKLSKSEIQSKTKKANKLTKNYKYHGKYSIEDYPNRANAIIIKSDDLNKDKFSLKYSGFQSNIYLITNNADYDNALKKENLIKILDNTIFTTSKGIKDFQFIKDNLDEITFIDTSECITNQISLMKYDRIMVLANPDIMAFIALIYEKNISPYNHLRTNYNYFKSIFKGVKLRILESVRNTTDYTHNSEFYHNMKYLRDKCP